MKKQDKQRKINDNSDHYSEKQGKPVNYEWEKLQDRYYMNLLNDLKKADIDDEEMLDHLDDFKYPAF